MRMIILSLSLFLSGCFYSMVGLDMSVEGRHKMWVEDMLKNIGQKNMYDCSYWICGYRKIDYIFLGDSKLPNGNLEAGYKHSLDRKGTKFCRYFFEYEPATGLVVGFRFEEPEPFACRITGA